MARGGCARCGQKAAFRSPFCTACKSQFAVIKPQVLERARHVLSWAGPVSREWDSLVADVTASGFPFGYFLDELQPDARNYLSRQRAFVLADGVVTAEELRRFHEAAARLKVSADFVQPMAGGLERAFRISEVRAGRLQQVQVNDVHLASDEFCYFVGGAVRYRLLRSGAVPHQGRVILTSKSFVFAAPSQGGQLPWSKINRVMAGPTGTVELESSSSRLAGPISVGDSEWVAEIANTLVRIDRRQILDSRRGRSPIPQHVRAEVWRRDGGRCKECGLDGSGGASLEFDHIIPISRGGADTVENLQVLCRRCNGQKSDRI